MSGDIVERLRSQANDLRQGALYSPSEDPSWDATTDAADAIEERDAEIEWLRAENATLRRNEWRLIWGLCTDCGANRDKEARRG